MDQLQSPGVTAKEDFRRLRSKRASRYGKVKARIKELKNVQIEERYNELIALFDEDREAGFSAIDAIEDEARRQAEAETPSSLTEEEIKQYNRARRLRSYVKLWRGEYSDIVTERMEKSAEKAHKFVEQEEETLAWFLSCSPSIAEFTGEEGKTSFDKQDVITRVFDSGSVSTTKKEDVYNGIVRAFRSSGKRVDAHIDRIREEILAYEDDPVGDIAAAAETFGLVRVFEDSDDGCLWFQNPETEKYHYISLLDWHSYLDIFVYGRRKSHIYEKWAEREDLDLSHLIIELPKQGFYPLREHAHRYFGMWDGYIRPWLAKNVEKGNVPPSHFDIELTVKGGSANRHR